MLATAFTALRTEVGVYECFRKGGVLHRGEEGARGCRALSGSQSEKTNNKWLKKITTLIRQNKNRDIDSKSYIPLCCNGRSLDGFSCGVLQKNQQLLSVERSSPFWSSELL